MLITTRSKSSAAWPIALMGNSQGNLKAVCSDVCMLKIPRWLTNWERSRSQLSDRGVAALFTHSLFIGLIESHHPPPQRTGPSVGHWALVEAGDGQYLARRAGEPHLVGMTQRAGGEARLLKRDAVGGGQFQDQVARHARQQKRPFRRRHQHAVSHYENIAGRALGDHAVADQNGLHRALIDRLLTQQDVRQQGEGLDVATLPANVVESDGGDAVLGEVGRQRLERTAGAEHRRPHDKQKNVIARRGSAGHLHVHRLVAAAVARHQGMQALSPGVLAERIAAADLAAAARQPREMLLQSEQLSAVDRNHLVHAVAEHEAAIGHRHPGLLEGKVIAIEINRRHRIPLYCSHSRTVSDRRWNSPPSATGASAPSGWDSSPSMSRLTLSVPYCWPFAAGAIIGFASFISALRSLYLPRGSVT